LIAFVQAAGVVVFVLYWNGQLCGDLKRQRDLFEAISSDDIDSFYKLIGKANINKQTDFFINRPTPIIYAASYGRLEMTGFLLLNGADPNAGDRHGFAALYYCLRSPFLGGEDDKDSGKVVEMLVEHGADIYGKGITNAIELLPPEDQRLKIYHELLLKRDVKMNSTRQQMNSTRQP
jgi:hypothetical protein